ncbi:hypothetical protein DYG63_20610 [Yersinia enterocolitica]|nr:hypothetical protein [Yersinia enterocolitica]
MILWVATEPLHFTVKIMSTEIYVGAPVVRKEGSMQMMTVTSAMGGYCWCSWQCDNGQPGNERFRMHELELAPLTLSNGTVFMVLN